MSTDERALAAALWDGEPPSPLHIEWLRANAKWMRAAASATFNAEVPPMPGEPRQPTGSALLRLAGYLDGLSDALESTRRHLPPASEAPAPDANEDTARLDWLEDCHRSYDQCPDGSWLVEEGDLHGSYVVGRGPNLRKAIDSARAAEKGE